MKKKGSALVVAIFVITLVGSVTFGMGRLIFLETDTTVTHESGTIAYYAAESGIEEAFLRYRYNQDTQLPILASDWSLPQNQNQFVRSDLSIEKVLSLAVDTSKDDGLNGQNQAYDLRMGSSAQDFGALSGVTWTNTSDTNCIQRDEVKKFSVDFSDQNNRDVNLNFLPQTGSAGNTGFFAGKEECALLEVKIIGKDKLTEEIGERKLMFYNPACNYGTMITTTDGSTRPYNTAGGSYSTGNLKNQIWPTSSFKEAELLIRPVGATIAFSLSKVGPGWFYGATTRIDSRGYYGGISKKLTASIDRQSGTLYDLFDYVIYKAE